MKYINTNTIYNVYFQYNTIYNDTINVCLLMYHVSINEIVIILLILQCSNEIQCLYNKYNTNIMS